MEARNGKAKRPTQLALFPEISGMEGEWLSFPFRLHDPTDLEFLVLQSFARFMSSGSQLGHQNGDAPRTVKGKA